MLLRIEHPCKRHDDICVSGAGGDVPADDFPPALLFGDEASVMQETKLGTQHMQPGSPTVSMLCVMSMC